MALYIPHSIFHLAGLLYVGPETFGPYYVCVCVYTHARTRTPARARNLLVFDTAPSKYAVGSKSFRPDRLFKVTEIKQLCYFST